MISITARDAVINRQIDVILFQSWRAHSARRESAIEAPTVHRIPESNLISFNSLGFLLCAAILRFWRLSASWPGFIGMILPIRFQETPPIEAETGHFFAQ